ncbi:ABC-type transport system involved in multi-copper enzyme maturation%2C permease component [uncultured Roseburia sp.]|uniref:ABC transporter permease n=1 Tax=Brotonthovivens ammoniilytica TaxID=2981725 RepID=A0ABT2TLM0_9FIRM|nr:hypothetical protein [Brotonthovivens ammoniilytica]MCU6762586.1 hypothetical protein [Brotonthovivens ammoniilytica]SCI76485.1 ABC-type transport system involved in multi-copper enzyme maturation%2C permease component [uncultured Roseburia sp.]
MKSKTSCFNRTIFQKNINRFWPVWTLYLIILLVIIPLSLFMQTGASYPGLSESDITSLKLTSLASTLDTGLSVFLICLFSIICAIAMFSYLFSARSCNMIHALPLKRSELFTTNYVSGLLFLVIPQAVTFLSSLIICIIRGITNVEHLFFWLLYVMGMTFFFYTLSVFCCMLSGHICASAAYFVLILAVFRLIKFLLSNLLAAICFGFSSVDTTLFYDTSASQGEFLSPYTFLSYFVSVQTKTSDSGAAVSISLTGGRYILLYCIPAVLLLIFSAVLYQRRQLETSGDIVAVRWLKPVFRWLIACMAGLGTGYFFSELFFHTARYYFPALLILTAIFAGIWYFIAEMLLQKRFRVFKRKSVPQLIICIGITLGFLGCLKGDIFRFEETVPEKRNIEAVTVSSTQDFTTDDQDMIQQILDIHHEIVDHKQKYKKYQNNQDFFSYTALYSDTSYGDDSQDTAITSTGITLTYYLSDGSHLTRAYIIPVTKEAFSDSQSAASQLRKILSDTDIYLKNIICENYKDADLRGGNFSTLSLGKTIEEHNIELTSKQAKVIFEAYKKDLEEGSLALNIDDLNKETADTYYNTLSLIFYSEDGIKSPPSPEKYMNNDIVQPVFGGSYVTSISSGPDESLNTTDAYLQFNADCRHTIEALQTLGLITSESDLITGEQYDDYYSQYE